MKRRLFLKGSLAATSVAAAVGAGLLTPSAVFANTTKFTQFAKMSGLKNTRQRLIKMVPIDQAKRLGTIGFQTGVVFFAKKLLIKMVGEKRAVETNIPASISKIA